jgi:Ion transport protein
MAPLFALTSACYLHYSGRETASDKIRLVQAGFLQLIQASLIQHVCMQAMLLLFELTTMDNWPTVMHSGMDAAGVDVQPVTNRSSSFSLFFVVFICVSAFFLTRAFIGVFIKQVSKLYSIDEDILNQMR